MPIQYQKNWVQDEWFTDQYQAHKRENFDLLDAYLTQPPQTILDIGSGLAWESRLFAQQYGTQLYLLDGDFDNNDFDRNLVQARYVPDAKDFAFYYKLDYLREQLDLLGTENYQLIDANNIQLSDHIKFDLITSWVSCGFHYPIETYRDLIVKHSHENTVVVMDLRVPSKAAVPVIESFVEVVKVLNRRHKYQTTHIRLS